MVFVPDSFLLCHLTKYCIIQGYYDNCPHMHCFAADPFSALQIWCSIAKGYFDMIHHRPQQRHTGNGKDEGSDKMDHVCL